MSISSQSPDDSGSESIISGTKSTQKRPRPSEGFYESFICPICYEYLTPPVIRCLKDHNLCLTCFERMEIMSGGNRCPSCRVPIDKDNRNRFVEEQLEQLFVQCQWKSQGCSQKIPLSKRGKHEKTCEFRPGGIKCYYHIASGSSYCEWEGKPSNLWEHLKVTHKCDVIEREYFIRFLWNPPAEDVLRIRPRVLKIGFPSDGNAFTIFILEHFYDPVEKVALFMVRTLDSDVKLNYSIDLVDRHHQEMGLTFRGITMDFESPDSFALSDYPDCDLRQVFQVPIKLLQQFTFTLEGENLDYFSFHVIFDIPSKEI